MFSAISLGINSHRSAPYLQKPAILLDLAGLVTVIVLGALALHNIGGSESLISSLNAVPGGAWGMIAGGVVTAAAVYLINKKPQQESMLSGGRYVPGREDVSTEGPD